MVIAAAQCAMCRHWKAGNLCSAFRDEIPDDIWWGRHDHRKPYKGDRGIRFEPVDAPPAATKDRKANDA